MNKIDLAAALKLSLNGLTNQLRVKFCNNRTNGASILRGCCDDGHFAQTAQSHVERTRDGCCRKCDDVDLCFEFFEVLFLFDAEFLFLVDDEESQVFEVQLRRKQFMRSDEDVDFAFLCASKNFRSLFGFFQT